MTLKIGLTCSSYLWARGKRIFEEDETMAAYADFVRAGNAVPVILTGDNWRPQQRKYDALILTGGADIWPPFYGGSISKRIKKTDTLRDAMEFSLLNFWRRKEESGARSLTMPTLGICRGMQLLNVFFGGGLCQHLFNAEKYHWNRRGKFFRTHEVNLVQGTKIAGIYSEIARGGLLEVNSFHHQGVKLFKVARSFRIAAIGPHGVVEAAEARANQIPVWGVQWHPEQPVFSSSSVRANDTCLIHAFIRESARSLVKK